MPTRHRRQHHHHSWPIQGCEYSLRVWGSLEPATASPQTAVLTQKCSQLYLSFCAGLQIRLIDLQREAVRPYSSHASSIHSILPLSTAMFCSGGADGSIRCHDSRVPSGNSNEGAAHHSLLGRRLGRGRWCVVEACWPQCMLCVVIMPWRPASMQTRVAAGTMHAISCNASMHSPLWCAVLCCDLQWSKGQSQQGV